MRDGPLDHFCPDPLDQIGVEVALDRAVADMGDHLGHPARGAGRQLLERFRGDPDVRPPGLETT
jgi:hypothetical protein